MTVLSAEFTVDTARGSEGMYIVSSRPAFRGTRVTTLSLGAFMLSGAFSEANAQRLGQFFIQLAAQIHAESETGT